MKNNDLLAAYWSHPPERLTAALHSGAEGLSGHVAARRLRRHGPNLLRDAEGAGVLGPLLTQFRSPLVLILVFAALVSIAVRDWVDAAIIIAIVLGSALLGFLQEYRASRAVARLRERVTVRATVLRDGRPQSVVAARIVPGDVVLLAAGSLVPADGVVLEARDFFVSQAVLTGETFPVEKQPGTVAAHAGLPQRTNCVFMGTSVRSGTARVLIVHTGADSAYGRIAARLALRPPETEFERGLRRFGYLLTRIMLVLVVAVFAVNLFLERPPVDSLLFALALAVGLSPELLPAILSVTLAHGAQDMAARGVIVRRLNAIENLGSMDVLCTDKTGTLTEGVVRLDTALDAHGAPSAAVLHAAWLNARFQTGLVNPLDEAIRTRGQRDGLDEAGWRKLDEIPYDFVRRRLGVVAQDANGAAVLIVKGAFDNVLGVCDRVRDGERLTALDAARREELERRFRAWGAEGFRVLGLASRPVAPQPVYGRADERALVFEGFLLFFDPPKPDVRRTLAELARLGVRLKIITGDNRHVAAHLAAAVGLDPAHMLTGAELDELHDEALWHLVERVHLFVEVDPNQKERIIAALRKRGHVVGYLGDGINDAPALHAADVGISVDRAADVAKEAADFVLLAHDLEVLRQGIEEGRTTFANTLKYLFVTSSANFGNMVSMAAASAFLPFLPLLAKQILLNNFLSDIPAVAIAGDRVDRAWEATPHRWNIRLLRNFMVVFGLTSSAFDFLTFAVLLLLLGTDAELFRTGWFVESLLTQLAIVLVVRTYRPFYRSRPGRWLLRLTVAVAVVTMALPYSPIAPLFGFAPLPPTVLASLLLISALYVAASEAVKRFLYRRIGR